MPFRKPLLGELLDYSDPLTKGLVGFWLMNEGSGNKIFDLSGNGGNAGTGTLSGVDWVVGTTGPELYFGGSNDKVTIPDSALYDFAGAFTIVVKVKCTVADALQTFVQRYDAGSGDGFKLAQFTAGAGKYFFQVTIGAAADDVRSATPPSITDYEHLVGIRQGDGTLIMYRNGILEIDTGTKAGAIDSNGTLNLGINHDDTADFIGNLGYVKIYNRELNVNEIYDDIREPFRFVGRRRREGAVAGGVSVAVPGGIVVLRRRIEAA